MSRIPVSVTRCWFITLRHLWIFYYNQYFIFEPQICTAQCLQEQEPVDIPAYMMGINLKQGICHHGQQLVTSLGTKGISKLCNECHPHNKNKYLQTLTPDQVFVHHTVCKAQSWHLWQAFPIVFWSLPNIFRKESGYFIQNLKKFPFMVIVSIFENNPTTN